MQTTSRKEVYTEQRTVRSSSPTAPPQRSFSPSRSVPVSTVPPQRSFSPSRSVPASGYQTPYEPRSGYQTPAVQGTGYNTPLQPRSGYQTPAVRGTGPPTARAPLASGYATPNEVNWKSAPAAPGGSGQGYGTLPLDTRAYSQGYAAGGSFDAPPLRTPSSRQRQMPPTSFQEPSLPPSFIKKDRHWKYSMFAYCKPAQCCILFCFPCCITYEMIWLSAPFEMVGFGCIALQESALLLTCMIWILGILTMGLLSQCILFSVVTGIKKKLSISEDHLTTCAKLCCCLCCYQVQIVRQGEEVGLPIQVTRLDDSDF